MYFLIQDKKKKPWHWKGLVRKHCYSQEHMNVKLLLRQYFLLNSLKKYLKPYF